MLRCRLLGHRFRFTAAGPTMTWRCARGCGAVGSKTYRSEDDARRYATAFDREDTADLGSRAPLVGLFPLRLLRVLRRNGERRSRRDGRTGGGQR